jgi:Uncharacterized protein conserved in bacteria
MQRKTIVVLGMHRSGTSAIARMLNLLGCGLPNTLMPEAPSNPKGHWESNAIMSLNDDILHSAGSSWTDWLEFNPSWYDSPVVEDFLQRGSTVLHAEYGMSPLFVLKDPRNCRLARFWFSILDRAAVTPLVVIPLRNPLEVVDSLEARDGMHRDLAMLLWLRHVLDAEHGSRGRRRVFLTYENLLDDWAGVAERMQNTLGISWPRFSILTAMDMEAFLDTGSRHHVRSESSVRSNRTLSDWVRDTDAILRQWSSSEENPGDHAALDDIRQQLNAAGPAFAKLTYAVSSERRQNVELRALLLAREGELAQLNNEIEQSRYTQTVNDQQWGQHIEGFKTQVQHLEGIRLELEVKKAVLENDLARLREHVEKVEADLRSTLADKEAGATAFGAAQQDVERLQHELADHRHELGIVQSALCQREEEIVQALSSLDETKQCLAEARSETALLNKLLEQGQTERAELAKSQGVRGEKQRRGAPSQSEVVILSKLLKQREAELASIRSSSGEISQLSKMLKVKEEAAGRTARHADWLEQVNAVVTGYPVWWAFAPKNLREKWQNGRLLRRGLFDAESYLARYPDVSSSGINPLRHYILHGISEKRTF